MKMPYAQLLTGSHTRQAAVVDFDVDFIFKRKDQAEHLARKLIEDGRLTFTWAQEMTETSHQWRINVEGPWAKNLHWMAEEAMKVDAYPPELADGVYVPETPTP